MKSIKMSYRGFCFDANPSTVKAELSKIVSTAHVPFKNSQSKEVGNAPAVIKGSGRFVGEDARVQAQMLLATFKRGGAAYLFSPVLAPVKAYFTSLQFSVNAQEECIEYSFEFTQAPSAKNGSFDFGYTVAQAGENLFDISNRTGTAIETIIDLNDYEEPFAVEEGDRVWLR